LAAHLEKFDGTLVRRGTPVEKHCRGGQTFWITGQILRKNIVAGHKKNLNKKIGLVFFHFKPKRD
jgi:hypothetical protein